MNPLYHARSAAAAHGGRWQDYIAVHTFFDQSKAAFPGVQHRMFLHSVDLGRALALKALGPSLTNSDGAVIDMNTLIDQHMREDLGFPVTLDDWLANLSGTFLTGLARRRVPLEEKFRPMGEDPCGTAARVWGGEPDEYRCVHDILTLAEAHSSHPAAHVLTNNALAIFLAEQIVGPAVECRDGHLVPVRLVAEKMVHARTGLILSPAQIAAQVRAVPWMRGSRVRGAKSAWVREETEV